MRTQIYNTLSSVTISISANTVSCIYTSVIGALSLKVGITISTTSVALAASKMVVYRLVPVVIVDV